MTTWKKEIERSMNIHNETWEDIVSSTFKDGEENVEFCDGYGGIDGDPFTVWTKERVFFPCCYDGSEWCSSVSRNPNGIACEHVGG